MVDNPTPPNPYVFNPPPGDTRPDSVQPPTLDHVPGVADSLGSLAAAERAELERLRADNERLTRERDDVQRENELRAAFSPRQDAVSPTAQPPTVGERAAAESGLTLDDLRKHITAERIIRTYENHRTRVGIRDTLDLAGLKFRQTDPANPNDVDTDSDGARAVELIQSLPVVDR